MSELGASEAFTLTCVACKKRQTGDLGELDRLGWTWFTGNKGVRRAACCEHHNHQTTKNYRVEAGLRTTYYAL